MSKTVRFRVQGRCRHRWGRDSIEIDVKMRCGGVSVVYFLAVVKTVVKLWGL